MATFTVHESPTHATDRIDRAADLVFVRDGFNWTGLLFGPFWMIAKGLWWPLVGYLGVLLVVGAAAPLIGLHPGALALVPMALNVLVGLEGSTLQRWTLARRGWAEIGSVVGRTAGECERRFFEGWLPTQPMLAGSQMRSGAAAMAGSIPRAQDTAPVAPPAQPAPQKPPGRWRSLGWRS